MIDISEPYKTILADEIKLVYEKIEEETDIRKKLYYYSATYSMVQRIINLDPKIDTQLIFIHIVLVISYKQIMERVSQILLGDRLITLPEDFFERLTTNLKELESKIRSNEDVYTVLENISLLTYITEGNGHYLLQTGKLKLP